MKEITELEGEIIKELAKEFGRQDEGRRILKLIDKMRDKHIHPRQSKLDYYDRWESSGCYHCYINRKIKRLKQQIKGD